MRNFDIVVVGAGAAGLIAAGRASSMGARVLLIEKMERPGRKLLITGKGRCNITNSASQSEYFKQIYPNGRFLKHAFATFFSDDIISLLGKFGVPTVLERGGRYFPESNSAADVVNALVQYCRKGNVEIRCKCKLEKLIVKNGIVTGLNVNYAGVSEEIIAKRIIITTGGLSYPATGSTGDGHRIASETEHNVVQMRPSLVPIETKGNIARELQGLSLKNVTASVWVNGKKQVGEFGEMLFTHFGLSGPIILTLSRIIGDEFRKKNKVEVHIDLKPALDEQKLDDRLIRDLNENGKKQVDNIFKEWLPSKLIPVFLNELQLDGSKLCNQVNGKERRNIMLLMKNMVFEVSGIRSFKEAIITAGGVDLNEIDSKTMESKRVKNLYFAGEVLDLDANTGGYNLQIAWSTGWLAGTSAANPET